MSARKKLPIALAAVAGSAAIAASLPGPASAQLQYGSWRKTRDCRPASPPVGFGRGSVRLPQTPGGKGAEECKWEREVLDCPRLRDKIRHPIQCAKRKQTTDYTQFAPRD